VSAHDPRSRERHQSGQASVELLGALPAMLLLGVVCFHFLAVGYAAVLAGHAAEAGALALAGGGDPEAGARDALPEASREDLRIAVSGDRVEVRLLPPTPVESVAERLEVEAAASVAR
jgi:hypothetical protein